ncbi:50S ribosomal protein L24 [Candidatus Woesearchaeota archaeon]|nr:50S ribosomal protein L24 [Candidatus Woesearchaeota archaeon]
MTWNPGWKASTQVRKQRKYRYNAPQHVLQGLLAAHLTDELREKLKHRSVPLRTGDKVKVMRGRFRGKVGKVSRINVEEGRVFVEGMELSKKDGTKISAALHPSNLLITDLDLGDRRRQESLRGA